MSPEIKNWLLNLKPGDTVIINPGGAFSRQAAKTVDKITATQIVIGTARYRKSDGYRMGEGTSYGARAYITPPTVEKLAEIERNDMIQYISMYDKKIGKLPTDLLKQVVEAMKQVA